MTEPATSYHVMPHPELREGRYAVRAVGPEHIEAIRQWRNAQIDVLRQSRPIAPEEQVAYYAREIWPDKESEYPTNILLIFLEDDVPLGYGGLVHINWDYKRAEVSFLLDPDVPRTEPQEAALFAVWLRFMKQLAFGDLKLNRLMTETYAMRQMYIFVLEQNGFLYEGRLREHVRVGGKPMDALVHGCLAYDAVKR